MTREQKAVIIMKSIERYGAPGCVKQGLAEIQEAERKDGAES